MRKDGGGALKEPYFCDITFRLHARGSGKHYEKLWICKQFQKIIITANKWFSEIGYLVSGSHFHHTASLPAIDYLHHFISEELKTSGKLNNFL